MRHHFTLVFASSKASALWTSQGKVSMHCRREFVIIFFAIGLWSSVASFVIWLRLFRVFSVCSVVQLFSCDFGFLVRTSADWIKYNFFLVVDWSSLIRGVCVNSRISMEIRLESVCWVFLLVGNEKMQYCFKFFFCILKTFPYLRAFTVID